MIVSGAEGSSTALFGASTGPLYQTPAGWGAFIPSPIGKPTGNGTPYRAFRSPGMGVTPSIPTFWERKGTEGGTEVKKGTEGSK